MSLSFLFHMRTHACFLLNVIGRQWCFRSNSIFQRPRGEGFCENYSSKCTTTGLDLVHAVHRLRLPQIVRVTADSCPTKQLNKLGACDQFLFVRKSPPLSFVGDGSAGPKLSLIKVLSFLVDTLHKLIYLCRFSELVLLVVLLSNAFLDMMIVRWLLNTRALASVQCLGPGWMVPLAKVIHLPPS